VRSGHGRPVGRIDFWIMATGVVMFFLSFAPWEGLSPASVLGIDVSPSLTFNAWQAQVSAWLPCLVCFAIAIAVGLHDFAGLEIPGIAGARPRMLLRVVSAVSFALLTIRLVTLASQHDPDAGQARWGVFIAFAVAAAQLVCVFVGAKKIGKVPATQA
jgi:hypothetical protein